jgi:tripartite-type tricarboxylate transporter receptor subunit TctC
MRKTLTLVAVVAALLAGSAEAQSVAEFYKGKTLNLIVGGDVGGAHDLYARVFAKHYGRHLPGSPVIVVQNMQGASGVVAANHMANVAPKDGSVIAAIYPANVVQPLFESGDQIKYDPRKLGWIGNIDSLALTCFTGPKSPVKTVEQAKAREVVVGSNSPLSSSSFLPAVMNKLIGTKFKVITGYTSGDMILNVDRGEIDGICGWAWSTIASSAPKWIEEKSVTFLAQSGVAKIPQIPDVPMVSDFATNPLDKQTFQLLDMRTALGRPYFAPPEVPADRLAALRDAFDKTMKDPAYLAETKQAKQDVNYIDYKGMEKLVADAYAMPEAVIKRVIELSKPPT